MKFIFPFLLFLSIQISAQTTIDFCVEVDSSGICKHPTTEFDIGKDGGTISLLVKDSLPLNASKLRYKIFYFDAYGNEKQENTLNQRIETDWTYAWQDVVFYDAGTYKVKVYKVEYDHENFLCSGLVKIFKP